ncbi:class I SAM-dependent methyltransferase [Candidatus Dependentiae bacterium]|nr:class I SAM-dependent methyltransferase [Candidatus Dependentiae bacterium]
MIKKYMFLLLSLLGIQSFSNADVTCPVCEKKYEKFIGSVHNTRPHCACPNCYSLERHRHFWLFLKTNHPEIFSGNITLLHWAPEKMLSKKLSSIPTINYIGGDLTPSEKSWCSVRQLDITQIDLPKNSIDVMICSHVLEHVSEDTKALQETMRILKPGGWALFMFPLYHNLDKTYENSTITTPQGRAIAFDHPEHVRKYGWDVLKKMKAIGFAVEVHLLKDLSSQDRLTYGLGKTGDEKDNFNNARRGADIIVCKKPLLKKPMIKKPTIKKPLLKKAA